VTVLFDQARHVPLGDATWDASRASEAIREILEWTLANHVPGAGWPAHPDEDGPPADHYQAIYNGAAGVLWVLDALGSYLDEPATLDLAEEVRAAAARYRETPDTGEVVPSLFLGEVGVLLTQRRLDPEADVDDRLFEVVDENIENPTLEALWGAPGTMLAAYFLHEATGEERWRELYRRNANHLMATWSRHDDPGCWYWIIDLYERKAPWVGAGHGFFGNAFALLKGAHLLEPDTATMVRERVAETLARSALEEDGAANWPTWFVDPQGKRFLMQWCHGAPGVLTSMGPFPVGEDPEVERLLVSGGEAVWRAGPLTKGAALCHGTDGNALALLEVYRRTGDERWLERARAFAAHALTTRSQRYSLYSGDLGLAWTLHACLEGRGGLPFLDMA
jgi:lantibiotic modifying enzyme